MHLHWFSLFVAFTLVQNNKKILVIVPYLNIEVGHTSIGTWYYVYIETTPRIIRFYCDDYDQASQPIIVPVGPGTFQYRKINYVMKIFADLQILEDQLEILYEKAVPSRTLGIDDSKATVSYVNTYTFVMSTNDVDAARDPIRKSELRHYTTCVSCG